MFRNILFPNKNHLNFFKYNYIKLISRHESTSIRIGCSSGFWGDTPTSNYQLVNHGDINYLVSDYLSEITMSLLTAAKNKNPELGYAPDFVHFAISPLLKEIKEKKIKVISNAGGTNPNACANELLKACEKAKVDLKVAVVTGDDIMSKIESLRNENIKEMFDGSCLPDKLMSLNVYFGAEPIKVALDEGADIVVTGRCVDSALVLAPLIHEFKWNLDEFDKLACGSLAGHLLECGAQATGGIFTDWKKVPNWDSIGFPVAQCYPDGQFIITKPENTGGLVSTQTVAEQLVYEIGNPSCYSLPDVNCDFTQVKLQEVGDDRVLVTGALGNPPSNQFKVCATHLEGFRCTAVFLVGGKNAIAKGRRTAESILKRVRKLFQMSGFSDFLRVNIQVIGDEWMYGTNARSYDLRETMTWIAVEHENKKALQLFTREIAAAGTGMAPGLCAFVGGRPKISPVLKLFSFLYDKSKLPAQVHLSHSTIACPHQLHDCDVINESIESRNDDVTYGDASCILEDLVIARSGDKGNWANIGVICRHPDFVPYIRHKLTTEVVHKYFEHLFKDSDPQVAVQRYELPGISGFNFVMRDCLGGGGVASLRTDPQGKSFAQMILDLELKNLPEDIVRLAKQLKED